jgi:hypothetical protein
VQKGNLSLAKGAPYVARDDFEDALDHFPDHPAAIVGLSNILLDIYAEQLLPPPAVPTLPLVGDSVSATGVSTSNGMAGHKGRAEGTAGKHDPALSPFPSGPLGLRTSSTGDSPQTSAAQRRPGLLNGNGSASRLGQPEAAQRDELELEPPYKAKSLPLNDRLAARDRAYGLLTGLTKLGSGWNDSEAWFALARAYEESGQPDKAKEALWWCVELEEAAGVREWSTVSGAGGYVL